MTTINRLNATINDHNAAANFVALFLLMSISVISAVAITHSGDLAKSSYDTFVQSLPTTSVPVTEDAASKSQPAQQTSATTLSVGDSSPLSLQNQPNDVAAQLQPAQNVDHFQTTVTTDALQPSVNTVQVTGGANLQNTVSTL